VAHVGLATAIATRGITNVNPIGGGGRATWGYITQGIPVDLESIVPAPLLSTAAHDENGIQRLLNNNVVDIRYTEVFRSVFWHPDREYTGFAADGFWYTDGLLDPTHVPFKATWAQEGESEASINRGDLDRFPKKILVVATVQEIAIFNADDLTLWMRFNLAVVSPPGFGPFLGAPSFEIRSVSFDNGFLVVATNGGLRIADFRTDKALALGSASSKRSVTTGLANRNSSTYMDGSTISLFISSDDCLMVDTEILSLPSGAVKRGYTVCALAHPVGFDGIILSKPGISAPTVKATIIDKNVTSAWEVDDDEDGDTESPFFIDAGTSWLGQQVAPGDILSTDAATEHTVVAIEQIVPGSHLVLDPELELDQAGAEYTIRRQVPVVRINAQAGCYFANGENRVTSVQTTDWFEGGTPIFTNLSTGHATAGLNATVDSINDLFVTATGDVYIATSIGIFYISAEDLDENRTAVFTYSSTSVATGTATYQILEGVGESCPAVAVDPETGNVLVVLDEIEGAVTVKSVISEINPNIHQTFRYFDQVGIVRALVSYRNPTGPPDNTEVE